MNMVVINTFLFLVFLKTSAFARVLELSDKFLEKRKEGMWLVEFYAPWCGHCKRLEPIWNQVGQHFYYGPIKVGRLDCTRFSSVASEFGVRGFPTILYIEGDKTYTHNGDRTRIDIIDFAEKAMGPAVRELTNVGQLGDVRRQRKVFFLFVKNENDNEKLKGHYSELAEKFITAAFFYIISREHVPEDIIIPTLPAILVFKDNDYFIFKDSLESLESWINEERFVIFPKVTHGNLHELSESKKLLVFAVIELFGQDKMRAPEERFFQIMKTMAFEEKERFKRFQFAWMSDNEMANSITMSSLDYPSLLVYNPVTQHYFIPEEDAKDMTSISLGNFLEQITSGTAKTYGGSGISLKIYRFFYEIFTFIHSIWSGQPLLATLIFGVPLGILSLICYSICVSDVSEMEEVDEDERLEEFQHEKKE